MKKIKYILIIFAPAFLCSCKKELNVFPTNQEVDGNVIVDTKSASATLNGVYYRFDNGGADNNQIPTIFWQDIHEISPSTLCGLVSQPNSVNLFSNLSFSSEYYRIKDIWDYNYKIVNAANGFLKNVAPVKAIPLATKKEMEGEARFLRAFANAELLLYYGQYNDVNSKYGILLRTEFVEPNIINLPRSTVAQSYNAILADLDSAIAVLPAQNTQPYYANASAAKLLKARVLINRGAAGDYAKVISLTSDVIENGPFTLEENVKDIFLTKGFTSKEVILAIQPYPNQAYKFTENQIYNEYVVSDTLVSLLKNDPRNQWVYKNDQGKNNHGEEHEPLNQITKYYTGSLADPVVTPLSENSYAFRLTEAYLLKAEAITLSGGDMAKAKTLLKQVEIHAGITDFTDIEKASSPTALQVLIIKEVMKNFVSENGIDWLAFRRLPFSVAQSIQPALKTTHQYIFPIPNSEITTNGNVVQNP